MNPRTAHDIVENLKVDSVRFFLSVCDYDVFHFQEFISDRFNKTYRSTYTIPENFNLMDCKLLAMSFKRVQDEKVLKHIIYLFVHHHLMILQHKLYPDGELKVMRAKICFASGIFLDEVRVSWESKGGRNIISPALLSF